MARRTGSPQPDPAVERRQIVARARYPAVHRRCMRAAIATLLFKLPPFTPARGTCQTGDCPFRIAAPARWVGVILAGRAVEREGPAGPSRPADNHQTWPGPHYAHRFVGRSFPALPCLKHRLPGSWCSGVLILKSGRATEAHTRKKCATMRRLNPCSPMLSINGATRSGPRAQPQFLRSRYPGVQAEAKRADPRERVASAVEAMVKHGNDRHLVMADASAPFVSLLRTVAPHLPRHGIIEETRYSNPVRILSGHLILETEVVAFPIEHHEDALISVHDANTVR